MILVGSQRGGARDLAVHLLKSDNEHVRVHELRGFASDNLHGALNESYAISRGTRCKQFLFSLSINPPPDMQVSTEEFEAVINRAEVTLGLSGQPRAIVFHEKEGPGGTRRHAHAVWSRVDVEEMKAIQLSFTKRKLVGLSREIFVERSWSMPRGLMASEERDPRNFSLEEWQQAKRVKRDVHEIKTAIQDCWAASDSRPAFMAALESRGYKLARGDKRGHVAVDMHGEAYAVSRWAGVKTKDVRARLGELEVDFPSVEARKAEFAEQVSGRLRELHDEERRKEAEERKRREAERRALVERQRIERMEQAYALKARAEREAIERQARYNRGLRGLLDRITGKHGRIKAENLLAAQEAARRDAAERDAVISRQLAARRVLDDQRRDALRAIRDRKDELSADMARYAPQHRRETPVVQPERIRSADTSRAPPPAPDQAVDRETRKAEFIEKRREQAARRAHARGPRRDLER